MCGVCVCGRMGGFCILFFVALIKEKAAPLLLRFLYSVVVFSLRIVINFFFCNLEQIQFFLQGHMLSHYTPRVSLCTTRFALRYVHV